VAKVYDSYSFSFTGAYFVELNVSHYDACPNIVKKISSFPESILVANYNFSTIWRLYETAYPRSKVKEYLKSCGILVMGQV
jgi:hypothetical protein